MKNNKRGFSLVELLAVVVILGILSVITIVSYNRYIESAKHQSEVQAEKNVIMATKSFLQANKQYTPKNIGDVQKIKLTLLINNNYIKGDDYENVTLDKSYVNVQKISDNKYEYTVYLDGLSTPPDSSSTPDTDISINIKFNGSISDASFNLDMNACKSGINCTDKISSYSYIIYACSGESCINYKEVFNSGTKSGGNKVAISLKNVDITKYIDIEKYNKFKVSVVVTNDKGKKGYATTETSDLYDSVGPKCGDVHFINEDVPEEISADDILSGEKERTISVDCIDDGGSKCKRKSFEYTWSKDTCVDQNGEVIKSITIYDNKNNSTSCSIDPKITVKDTKPPTIKIYADNGDGKYGLKEYSKDNPLVVSGNGTIDASQFITEDNANGWLNKNFYKNGIKFYVEVSDDSNFSFIKDSLFSSSGDETFFNEGGKHLFKGSYIIKKDGKITAHIKIIDSQGNVSTITIKFNMDLNVSIPVGEIRETNESGRILSRGPNPSYYDKAYDKDIWIGNFNFNDDVSGFNNYSIRSCGTSPISFLNLIGGMSFKVIDGPFTNNCIIVRQMDNAGNTSGESGRYYFNVDGDVTGPDIKIFADNGKGNYGLKNYSSSKPLLVSGKKGTPVQYEIKENQYKTQADANNWLNKARYNNGIFYYAVINDKSEIASVTWNYNDSGMTADNSRLKILNHNTLYTPGNSSEGKFSNNNRTFMSYWNIPEDGVRYAKLTATDVYGNKTTIKINAKIDKDVNTPTAEIRKNDKNGELISEGPNPQDESNYNDTNLWWGNFTGKDNMSGYNHFIYKKCDPDNNEFVIDDSNYVGEGKGFSIAPDFNSTSRNTCYQLRQIDNAGNTSLWSDPYYLNIQKDSKGPNIRIYADNGNGQHGLRGYSEKNPLVLSGDSSNYKIDYDRYDTQYSEWLNNAYYPNGIKYYVNIEDDGELKQVYWAYNSPGRNKLSNPEPTIHDEFFSSESSDKFSNDKRKFSNTFSLSEGAEEDGVRYAVLIAEDMSGKKTKVEFVVKIDRHVDIPQGEVRNNNSSGSLISVGPNSQDENNFYNNNLWWGNFTGKDNMSGYDNYKYMNCSDNIVRDIDDKYIGENKGYLFSPKSDSNLALGCYKIKGSDKAGNSSGWSDPYYFNINSRGPSIEISADNGDSNGNDHGFSKKTFSGQTSDSDEYIIDESMYETQSDANNWLNNAWYPSGIAYRVKIKDPVGIKKITWSTNKSKLAENSNKIEYLTDSSPYTPSSHSSKFTNNNKEFNYAWGIGEEGVRYATIVAENNDGFITTLKIYAKIDRTTETNAQICYDNKCNPVISNGPNTDSYSSKNDLWWGNFSPDKLAGMKSYLFKDCSNDGSTTYNIESNYLGIGNGYSFSTDEGMNSTKCYNLRQIDNAGNDSGWQGPYYIIIKKDDTGPTININADNGSGNHGFDNITIPGQGSNDSSYVISTDAYDTQTIDSAENDLANANGWLNKAWYPYGINYNVDISDNSGIKKVTWSTNQAGLTSGSSNIKKLTASSSYTPSSHSSNFTNNNKNFNYEWGIGKDGVRYATIVAEDNNGNKTNVELNAKIDHTSPDFPTANIRRYNAEGEVLISKPNPTNTHNYITDLWWGDFAGTDAISGSRHYEYAVANKDDCSDPKYTGITDSGGYRKPNSGNSHHSCYMLRQLDNAGNYSERMVNDNIVRWSEGYRMDIEKPTLNTDADFTKWKVVYTSQPRSFCDTWSARPRILGYCPDGVYGNIVGKIEATYSNGDVTFDWYIAQSYGDGSYSGDYAGTWIAKGYYVELVIVPYSKNPNNFTQKDVDYCGEYSDDKVTKCVYLKHYNDPIWDIGSSHGPEEKSGEESITVHLPKGDYDIYFAGNSTKPSFTKWMGWIEVG